VASVEVSQNHFNNYKTRAELNDKENGKNLNLDSMKNTQNNDRSTENTRGKIGGMSETQKSIFS
jgi:hypothetical protein